MVRLLDWLTHLELDWEHSAWTPLYEALAARYQLIRYDAPVMASRTATLPISASTLKYAAWRRWSTPPAGRV